jgi:hypothetical protein
MCRNSYNVRAVNSRDNRLRQVPKLCELFGVLLVDAKNTLKASIIFGVIPLFVKNYALRAETTWETGVISEFTGLKLEKSAIC